MPYQVRLKLLYGRLTLAIECNGLTYHTLKSFTPVLIPSWTI